MNIFQFYISFLWYINHSEYFVHLIITVYKLYTWHNISNYFITAPIIFFFTSLSGCKLDYKSNLSAYFKTKIYLVVNVYGRVNGSFMLEKWQDKRIFMVCIFAELVIYYFTCRSTTRFCICRYDSRKT